MAGEAVDPKEAVQKIPPPPVYYPRAATRYSPRCSCKRWEKKHGMEGVGRRTPGGHDIVGPLHARIGGPMRWEKGTATATVDVRRCSLA